MHFPFDREKGWQEESYTIARLEQCNNSFEKVNLQHRQFHFIPCI
uniref:Uncharacterized protein n=1 Tax=Rhizophora mucronata TaxID=61149 RepID=A0A2P2P688_RHIMU